MGSPSGEEASREWAIQPCLNDRLRYRIIRIVGVLIRRRVARVACNPGALVLPAIVPQACFIRQRQVSLQPLLESCRVLVTPSRVQCYGGSQARVVGAVQRGVGDLRPVPVDLERELVVHRADGDAVLLRLADGIGERAAGQVLAGSLRLEILVVVEECAHRRAPGQPGSQELGGVIDCAPCLGFAHGLTTARGIQAEVCGGDACRGQGGVGLVIDDGILAPAKGGHKSVVEHVALPSEALGEVREFRLVGSCDQGREICRVARV